MGQFAAVASRVQQHAVAPVLRIWSVVVGAEDEIHSLKTRQQVQPLTLQLAPLTIAGPGVYRYNHQMGLLLGPHPVHIRLHAFHQVHEMHPIPYFPGQPGLDIRVRISQHSHSQPASFDNRVRLEIRLAVVVAYGVRCQIRNLQLFFEAVIYFVSRLYVVVADDEGVIFHIFDHTAGQMTAFRVHVVVVIYGIVALQQVADVEKHNIVFALFGPRPVHICADGEQGFAGSVAYVKGVEEAAVDVVCSIYVQTVFPVLRGLCRVAGANCDKDGGKCKQVIYCSHYVVFM